MKIIENKIIGDVTLNQDTELYGMIVGSTIIEENILLKLHGTITGNLILHKKSTVLHHGTVNGDVINEGGFLNIFGVVDGQVVRKDGNTVINSKAIIEKGLY